MDYNSQKMLESLNAKLDDNRITSEQLKRADDYKKSLEAYTKQSEKMVREKAERFRRAQAPDSFRRSMNEEEKKELLKSINCNLHFLSIDFSDADQKAKERQTIEKLLDIQMEKREQALTKIEIAKSEGDPTKIADTMAQYEIISKNIATYEEQLKAIQ